MKTTQRTGRNINPAGTKGKRCIQVKGLRPQLLETGSKKQSKDRRIQFSRR